MTLAPTTKAGIRAAALKARAEIPSARLSELSSAVAVTVASAPEYVHAKTLAVYVAKGGEVQTETLIRRSMSIGKRVIVPSTRSGSRVLAFFQLKDYDHDLVEGRFGVPEPAPGRLRTVPLERAELVLVPLVAWDSRGYRIGYGKGYFDATLAGVGKRVTTIGLGLESQRVDQIPEGAQDIRLTAIATEERLIRIPDGGRAA